MCDMEKLLKVIELNDWELAAAEILAVAKPTSEATILTLTGDLGAGKTTLVQTLAKQLDVSEVVTSPTFTIMKGYELNGVNGFSRLLHMDAYRIDDLEELKPLRFKEILSDPNTLVCIEWAEKIAESLPKQVISISISHLKNEEREVVLCS